MSGKHSGVQARIKEQAKHAFYIHCNAHCLNLVLVDTVKAIPEVGEFFSLTLGVKQLKIKSEILGWFWRQTLVSVVMSKQ